MYEVTYRIAQEIISHEAIVRQAYKDSVGVWTWSVGLTSATGHNVERYIGKPQSLDHCLRVYCWALDNYADEVRKTFAGFDLTEEEFGAALSFHWNTGKIKVASWVKTFKAGNKKLARAQFLQYNKPAEIKARREAEADLLFNGDWSSNGTCTEYTRVSSAGKIDWSSGKKINVTAQLMAAISGEIPESDKVITEKIITKTEEVPMPVPVPVTPPSMDGPWWKSKEVVAPLLSAGGIGGATTFFEKFGSIPTGNLIALLIFATVVLIGALLYFRNRDINKVDKEVKKLG